MKLGDDLLPIHDLVVELVNEAVRIDRPAALGRLQHGSPKHPTAPFMEVPKVMSEVGGPAMSPFLAAQGDSPFDPALMLIQGDWLGERGPCPDPPDTPSPWPPGGSGDRSWLDPGVSDLAHPGMVTR